MSIEDLDYLAKNNIQENIIILVDSAKRDKVFWPSPNDFRIDFDTPFKNVYGVDILDISIPRTMYSVDYNKNKIVIKSGIVDDIDSDKDDIVTILDNRDYTLKEIISEMGIENSPIFKNNILVNVENDVSVHERKSIIVYTSVGDPPAPFLFDMQKSTTKDVLGFNEIAQDKNKDKYRKWHNPKNHYLFTSIPNYIDDNVVVNTRWTISSKVFEILNMNNSEGTATDILNKGTIYTNLNNTNYVGQSYHITGITFDGFDLPIEDKDYELYIYKLSYEAEGSAFDETRKALILKNFRLTTNKNNIQTIIDSKNDIDAENIELVCVKSFTKKDNTFSYVIDKEDINPYYFQSIPISVIGNVFYLVYIHTNGSFSDSSFDVTVNVDIIENFNLISPGVVQLSGERYITVRCDEIENHLRGSMMFNEYSPGLAMVNLGVQGFTENRMDFFSVKYKEFHPIGKLKGMRFTLKTSNDMLYDLKTVDWHMLVSIKYYVPKNKRIFKKSILNPNYNIDFIQYQIEKSNIMNIQQKENVEDENELSMSEEEYDNNHTNKLLSEREFQANYLRKEIELKEEFLREHKGGYDTETTSEESSDDSSEK